MKSQGSGTFACRSGVSPACDSKAWSNNPPEWPEFDAGTQIATGGRGTESPWEGWVRSRGHGGHDDGRRNVAAWWA